MCKSANINCQAVILLQKLFVTLGVLHRMNYNSSEAVADFGSIFIITLLVAVLGGTGILAEREGALTLLVGIRLVLMSRFSRNRWKPIQIVGLLLSALVLSVLAFRGLFLPIQFVCLSVGFFGRLFCTVSTTGTRT